MDPQFEELAEQIARDVTDKVTQAVNTHVTEVVTAAEKRLARQARIHARRLSRQARVNVEAVKEEARLAAEGYGGVLQSIDARLSRLESDLTTQLTHYDAVLNNHHERLGKLEQQRP
jgi:hypothetical protein